MDEAHQNEKEGGEGKAMRTNFSSVESGRWCSEYVYQGAWGVEVTKKPTEDVQWEADVQCRWCQSENKLEKRQLQLRMTSWQAQLRMCKCTDSSQRCVSTGRGQRLGLLPARVSPGTSWSLMLDPNKLPQLHLPLWNYCHCIKTQSHLTKAEMKPALQPLCWTADFLSHTPISVGRSSKWLN